MLSRSARNNPSSGAGVQHGNLHLCRKYHQTRQRCGILNERHGTRPRLTSKHPSPIPSTHRRHVRLEAGENKTGHVNTGPGQALLYFDNVFPLRLQWLLRLPWRTENVPNRVLYFLNNAGTDASTIDPASIVEKTSSKGSCPVHVVSVIPRLKEGGAFVKFALSDVADAEAESRKTKTDEPVKVVESPSVKTVKGRGRGKASELAPTPAALPTGSTAATTATAADETRAAAISLEHRLREYLRMHRIRPWWNPLTRLHARLVLGRPWIEDLRRPPSQILRVDFLSPPSSSAASSAIPPASTPSDTVLSQEQLYQLFRQYGLLADISFIQTDPKTTPGPSKYALLHFANIRRAMMARNCMHGYLVSEAEGGGKNGTVLRLTYEKKVKGKWIRDWLFSHPRIVIPVLAAILATVTVSVFDPVRSWFVKAHITRAFHVGDSRAWRWFISQATDLFHLDRARSEREASMGAIRDDQRVNVDEIRTWLMEDAETFIVVQGPRGTGKRELVVDQALDGRKYKLLIDCKPIQEARGDGATIRAIANEVGYRPVFSWMNSINSAIDLVAQSATGVKTGFSETLDGQASKILNTTATALKQIAVEGRKKTDKDAQVSEDEWLEAHPEKRPVVIIDNFLHKSHDGGMLMYDKLAEWSARLTTANIAHVIFLTHDMSFSKSLGKALPNRVFRQISLSDCSPEVAKRYVATQLSLDMSDDGTTVSSEPSPLSCSPSAFKSSLSSSSSSSPSSQTVVTPPSPPSSSTSSSSSAPSSSSSSITSPTLSALSNSRKTTTTSQTPEQRTQDALALAELDEAVSMLGGRLTDLDYLARRIRAGESPKRAVRAIADQSASEIQKAFLFMNGGGRSTGSEQQQEQQDGNRWTAEQAWVLVRLLAGMAKHDRYHSPAASTTTASTAGAATSISTPNSRKRDSSGRASKANTDEPIHYHALLLTDPLFGPGAGDVALVALAESELISVESHNGRPAAIRPGKPIFAHACALLVGDAVLSARMDLAVLSARIAREERGVEKAEREIGGLVGVMGGGVGVGGGSFDEGFSGGGAGGAGGGAGGGLGVGMGARELGKRVRWLVGKVGAAQEKIERWEGEGKALKEVLGRSY